ncbi:BTB/POZ protein [Gigaspora rosea]|uniref:BTB/POZ protein n=1 Tax=Gigaspora rosea TaxID=44941 RepID=A0A397VWI2_9GLOM|nr:BTB/POZ protein [Gigaspora rosea]CAG8575114.1 12743_t:CDS:2 [Gigaspora rosea]
MSEEKIILNIGGIKYETLRSTLTAQPVTLLGTMFRDRNEFIKNSVNGNEYFFDRNGKAFYYIMEFYRTGKLLWSTEIKEPQVTYQQLKEELDYFQINKLNIFSSLASETATNTIDRFISNFEQLIISHYINFDNQIFLTVSNNQLSVDNAYNNQLDSCLSQFKRCAFDILNNMEKQIEKHLVENFSEIELKWSCQRKTSNYPYHIPFFDIVITFSSPVEKLLKFKNSQANIVFVQTPINSPVEKIILNVGGKKYETFQSTLAAQPGTLLGAMFQDRNKCLRHPINGNEYFFDRNSEAFYYIMEFYRTGKLTWPTESGKVTCKQLEEELDYFQIPFNKSTILCSSAIETVRNNVNKLILGFEELIIRCCNYLRNNIDLEIRRDGVYIIDNKPNNGQQDLQKFCLSKFTFSNAISTLNSMEKLIGDHLVKQFSGLGLTWKFERNQRNQQRNQCNTYINISFSFKNIYKTFK